MKELIQQCRYYQGEEQCPESIAKKGMSQIWVYEQMWVEREGLRDENHWHINEYNQNGLKDFNVDDGTHITMKALLFNRYSHWSGGYENLGDGFREWYERNYIGMVNY